MKRLGLLALVGALFVPATSAHGAVPCRDRLYNDWYKDGKIGSTYPIACYRDALKHVPADARTYSSLADDIRAAEQGALARLHGRKNIPAQIGKGGKGGTLPVTSKLPNGTTSDHSTNPGQTTPTSTTVAAPASSSGGGGIPLPILILGAIAIFLVAVGAIGAGFRRFRRPS